MKTLKNNDYFFTNKETVKIIIIQNITIKYKKYIKMLKHLKINPYIKCFQIDIKDIKINFVILECQTNSKNKQ